jgi:hypothetical protein
MTDTGPLSCHDCAGDLPAGWDKPCPHCGSTARESKYQPEPDYLAMLQAHMADDTNKPALPKPGAAAQAKYRKNWLASLTPGQRAARRVTDNAAARARYAAAKADSAGEVLTMKKTLEERFWAKVDKSGGPSACWLWTASTNKGYGQLEIDGRPEGAHRIAYKLSIGPIPNGLSVCHSCDNPPCCNPSHLFLGSKLRRCLE